MVMAGMLFTRLSRRVWSTIQEGVEYRIRQRNDGVYAVLISGCVSYHAESFDDALEYIGDSQGESE